VFTVIPGLILQAVDFLYKLITLLGDISVLKLKGEVC